MFVDEMQDSQQIQIKMVNESFYFNLKKRIGNWVLNIINTDEDIDTKVVEEIKDYIEKDLRALFNFSLDNLELRKFLQLGYDDSV